MVIQYLNRLRPLFRRRGSNQSEPLPAQNKTELGTKLENIPALEAIFLALAAQKRAGLQVVQVGANDGVTNDPVFSLFHRYAESALLVEPQPSLIPLLRENYARFQGDLLIENMAVTAEEGSMKLFELTQDAGEKYHTATGFNPTGIAASCADHLAKHLLKYSIVTPDELSKAIRWQQVPSCPLERILELNRISEVDFLQIDTEGADWLVLQTLGSHRPPAINFEWVHLSSHEWSDCREWIMANRYKPFIGERDCLLIRDFSR